MAKTPTLRETLEDFDQAQKQFIYDYGLFLTRWGMFEMLLEVAIQRLSALTPKDAAIILGGLNFGAKPPILYSLLTDRRRPAAISKIKAVINHAKRNALVHGQVGSRMAPATFSFLKREVGDRMKISELKFDAKAFSAHVAELDNLIAKAMRSLRVYGNDIEQYAHEAGLFRPTRKRPQVRRQRARSGARSASPRRHSPTPLGS